MVPQHQAAPPPIRYSSWFVLVVAIFNTCLITANITAVKLVTVFHLVFPAAIFIFPVRYICGDALTEVYGYRQARWRPPVRPVPQAAPRRERPFTAG